MVLLFYVSKLWMAYQEVLKNNKNGHTVQYAIKFTNAKKVAKGLTFNIEDRDQVIQKTNVGVSSKVKLGQFIEYYKANLESNKDLECVLYANNSKVNILENHNIKNIEYDATNKSVSISFNKSLNFADAENYMGLVMLKINSKAIAKEVDFLSNVLNLLTPLINFIVKQIQNFTKPKQSSESGGDELKPPPPPLEGGSA